MFSEWPTLDHMYSHRSALLAGRWGCMTGFEWSCGLTNSTHDCQFPPELHDRSWGEAAPRIATGRWSRPWKNLWWPTNSTTSSVRGIIRGNEIDSSSHLRWSYHWASPPGDFGWGTSWRAGSLLFPHPSHQLSAIYACFVLSSVTW